MTKSTVSLMETLTHRLILPHDANHHGTLYAGSLLRIALEAGYATSYRLVGGGANLLLRRVLSLECNVPVPVGTVIEIRGAALHVRRAYMIVGLLGTPLQEGQRPWMDGLMGFVQVNDAGRPTPFPADSPLSEMQSPDWEPLRERLSKLLHL